MITEGLETRSKKLGRARERFHGSLESPCRVKKAVHIPCGLNHSGANAEVADQVKPIKSELDAATSPMLLERAGESI